MKKALIIVSIILCMCIIVFKLSTAGTKVKPIMKSSASYTKINGLDELKQLSSTIVEIVGTGKYKIVDYKGIPMRVSTLKVTEVLKGNNQLTEISIMQTEGLETETPPAKGEKLLLFLRDSREPEGQFKSCYVPLGGGQGMYKIKVKDNKKHLEVHCMKNDVILKDLSGDYDEVKLKIKD